MIRNLSTVILCFALVALITVCGGEAPPEGDNTGPPRSESEAVGPTDLPRSESEAGGPTALPRSESEAGSPAAQAESSDLSEIKKLSSDDILRFLFGTRAGNVNVLYIDVPQAIDALSQPAASDARTEFQELWDNWGFSETLDIDIRDLDYIAFGENRGPDNDLFLFGGVDFGGIRGILESVGWEEHDIGGAEAWAGKYDAMAFVGDAAVLGTYSDSDTFDSVLRFSGGYALAQDVLDGGTGSEILSVLTENKAARVAVLEYLDGLANDSLLIQWMELDLFQRYAEEDGAEHPFNDWGSKLDFARWLDGNRDALEDLAHWLAADADTIEASIRRLTAEEEVVPDELVGNVRRVTEEGHYALEVGSWSGFEIQIGKYEGWHEALSAVEQWQDGDDAALAHAWPAVAEEVRQTLGQIPIRHHTTPLPA